MRYPKDQKKATRRRLIAQAGSHAKKHGFDVSGMSSLAAAADVTTGALYKHFEDKADLFLALITAELQRTAKMYDTATFGHDFNAIRALSGYLSLDHVNHPEQGCPLPSLTPEIGRASEAVKDAYRAGLLNIHAKMQRLTVSPQDAWTLMAQNVGGVMLARALSDEKLQREILSTLREAGERLLADTQESPSRSAG